MPRQHESNVFLTVPTKSKCDDKPMMDLEDKCLSRTRHLSQHHKHDQLAGPKQAPGGWCTCYLTSRGSLAAHDAPGSNSPLVLGLNDPQSGILACGLSLEQGIKNACESVEKLAGVDTQQRTIKVNIDCLGNVSLQEWPQEVNEGDGSADTDISVRNCIVFEETGS